MHTVVAKTAEVCHKTAWPATPKDFVHERFRYIDAKLDKLLDSSETTNVRLTSMERRITALEGVHRGGS